MAAMHGLAGAADRCYVTSSKKSHYTESWGLSVTLHCVPRPQRLQKAKTICLLPASPNHSTTTRRWTIPSSPLQRPAPWLSTTPSLPLPQTPAAYTTLAFSTAGSHSLYRSSIAPLGFRIRYDSSSWDQSLRLDVASSNGQWTGLPAASLSLPTFNR